MPRRPAAYPAAYREQIIALARTGRSPKELAKEFEPSEQTIRKRIFQAEADRGERPGVLTSDERAELQRLRRENRQLKVERDILGKAAAWFARDSGTIPPESCQHQCEIAQNHQDELHTWEPSCEALRRPRTDATLVSSRGGGDWCTAGIPSCCYSTCWTRGSGSVPLPSS